MEDSNYKVNFIIAVLLLIIIILSAYSFYLLVLKNNPEPIDVEDGETYEEIENVIIPSKKAEDMPSQEEIYNIIKNGIWISGDQYYNEELDFGFTLIPDWKYTFNKDSSITLLNTIDGSAMRVTFSTNTLEEQQEIKREEYMNDESYKYVETCTYEFAGLPYSCITGFKNARGLDYYEFMCFMRESNNGKYVITINTVFVAGNTPYYMGNILQKDGNNSYTDLLNLEYLKSPKVTNEELLEREEKSNYAPPD